MRTFAGIVVSALVGVVLAVVASFAIVLANAPDKAVEATIKSSKDTKTSGNYKPPDVVVYGQR